MKGIFTTLILGAVYLTVPTESHLFSSRRSEHDAENAVHNEVGIPLVFKKDKPAFMKSTTPEHQKTEETFTRVSNIRDMSEDEDSDIDSGLVGSGKNDAEEDDDDDDNDDDDDDDADDNDDNDEEDEDQEQKKNPEELGLGYEKIGDMGSNNRDDDDKSTGSDGKESSKDEDIMNKTSGNTSKIPDLNGEFPPSADQVNQLPKEEELTLEQADRKMANKSKEGKAHRDLLAENLTFTCREVPDGKGYVQFTIRERYRPELRYKESAAYKILAGNVVHDVEKALRATGVVKDVFFREAKNVGGPPYRSKVQVFLKLQNVKYKKLKRIVDYGLINGMISVPGSFYAT